jgi:hypothetical protein
VDKYDRNTFCGRIRSDLLIIKECFKKKVVYKYYLFWVFRAICPIFSSYDYFQMTDVYEIDESQYGYLVTIGSVAGLLGVFMY